MIGSLSFRYLSLVPTQSESGPFPDQILVFDGETVQSLQMPGGGYTEVEFHLIGAAGGAGYFSGGPDSGGRRGGYVYASFTGANNLAGQTLPAVVGGGGEGVADTIRGGDGGWPGGGYGSAGNANGGGGGGYTGIFLGPLDHANALAVAGAGAGSTGLYSGGSAGGETGDNGSGASPALMGDGGSQVAGGTGGDAGSGFVAGDGGPLTGGDGYSQNTNDAYDGGGGGAGYYGGGAGISDAGGGGGSSFISGDAVSSGTWIYLNDIPQPVLTPRDGVTGLPATAADGGSGYIRARFDPGPEYGLTVWTNMLVDNQPPTPTATPISMAANVYATAVGIDRWLICRNGTRQTGIHINAAGFLQFELATDFSWHVWSSDVVVPLESWVHLAVTYSGSGNACTMYINGIAVPNTLVNSDGGLPEVDGPLWVARGPVLYAIGVSMAQAMITTSETPGATILDQAHRGAAGWWGDTPDRAHHWRFDISPRDAVDIIGDATNYIPGSAGGVFLDTIELPPNPDPPANAIEAVVEAAGDSGWGYWEASTLDGGVVPDSFGHVGREMTETGSAAALTTVIEEGRPAFHFSDGGLSAATNYLQGSEALSEYAFLHGGEAGTTVDVFTVLSRDVGTSGDRYYLATCKPDGAEIGLTFIGRSDGRARQWMALPANTGVTLSNTAEGGFGVQELVTTHFGEVSELEAYRVTRSALDSEGATSEKTVTPGNPSRALTMGTRADGDTSFAYPGKIWAVVILKNATEEQRDAVETAIKEHYLGIAPA